MTLRRQTTFPLIVYLINHNNMLYFKYMAKGGIRMFFKPLFENDVPSASRS